MSFAARSLDETLPSVASEVQPLGAAPNLITKETT